MIVDKTVFTIAIAFLGLALLFCIAAIATLAALNDGVPEAITTIAGVSGGALAGLFVNPHTNAS